MNEELQNCPNCGNTYLAIRSDIYKDQREFVYCDCCGCITEKEVWNRVRPEKDIPIKAGVDRFDLEQQIMRCWGVTEDIDTLYRAFGDTKMTEDQVMNVLLGMKELYDLKFNELFNTFEQLIKKKAL